jgi:hypothetical protein
MLSSRTVNGTLTSSGVRAVGGTALRAMDQVFVADRVNADTNAEASLLWHSVEHLVGVGAARPMV